MMEIYANEISFADGSRINDEAIHELTQVYIELKKHGIATCRITTDEYRKIIEALDCNQKKNVYDFIFSFFKQPFENGDLVGAMEDEYLTHMWTFDGVNCIGLPMAYISGTASLSLNDIKWKEWVPIHCDEACVDVRNISNRFHIQAHKQWLISLEPVQLLQTDLSPREKRVHFSDDHGKDKLSIFAKRILKSPYVVEIINSIQFNSHERSLVRRAREDGIIELVLFWTDEGYGMAVKTTGRNKRETDEIAEILEKEYGRGSE